MVVGAGMATVMRGGGEMGATAIEMQWPVTASERPWFE